MSVLEKWESVLVEFMPEREKLELFLKREGGTDYKMEIMFGDISENFLCCVEKEGESAILLKVTFPTNLI